MAPLPLGWILTLGVAIGTVAYAVFLEVQKRQRIPANANRPPFDMSNVFAEEETESSSSKRQRNSSSGRQCAICFDDLYSKIRMELSCGHEFHINCIKSWNRVKKTCPNCRSPMTL